MMSKRKPRRTNAPVARHAFVYVSHIYYSQVKSSQELVPILIVVKSSQVKREELYFRIIEVTFQYNEHFRIIEVTFQDYRNDFSVKYFSGL